MKMRHGLLVAALIGTATPCHADLGSLLGSILNKSTNATTGSNANVKPKGETAGDAATRPANIRDNDPFCQNPEESYSMWDNVAGLTGVAFKVGLTDLAAGGKVDQSKTMTALRAYSKEHLWLPTSVEDLYGSYQHNQRVKDGLVLSRQDANVKEKQLYERADRIFNRLMQYAPEKMPYDMHLYITTTQGVNAEAIPGGYVYITKEALTKYRQDDAMITFMLGHEIAHVSKRHLSKQFQERLVDSGLAIQLLQAALSQNQNSNPVAVLMPTKSFYDGLQGLFAKYDGDQELQADACSVNFSSSVKSDPQKGYSMFSRSHTKVDSAAAKKFAGLQFAEHPNNKERSGSLRKVIAFYAQLQAKADYTPPTPHSYTQAVDDGSGTDNSPGFLDKVGRFFNRAAAPAAEQDASGKTAPTDSKDSTTAQP